MRREWQDAADNRRWDEFERLIKWEPSQELCDALAGLANEATDKADKKALKKLLWILAKEGFQPEAAPEEESAAPAKPLVAAYMASADGAGDAQIIYGYETGGRFRWLETRVHETMGLRKASDSTMSPEDAHAWMDDYGSKPSKHFRTAPVDPDYALWRIKRATEKARSVPPPIALWRTKIDRASEMPHPVEGVRTGKEKPAEENVLLMDPALTWRLELGAATPIMDAMFEAQKNSEHLGEEAQTEAVKAAGMAARGQVVTDEVVADHLMRLRDLAYLMHLTNDKDAPSVLATLAELEKNGVNSEYMKALVDKTVVLYFEVMKSPQDA